MLPSNSQLANTTIPYIQNTLDNFWVFRVINKRHNCLCTLTEIFLGNTFLSIDFQTLPMCCWFNKVKEVILNAVQFTRSCTTRWICTIHKGLRRSCNKTFLEIIISFSTWSLLPNQIPPFVRYIACIIFNISRYWSLVSVDINISNGMAVF